MARRSSSAPPWLLPLVGLAALAWTLNSWLPPTATLSPAAIDRQELLRGTWLREYSERGVRVRRVLELEGGGAFRESVRIAEPEGRVTRMEHEGTWLYDGTNLKRKYTRMNGEPPSRLKVPFATFEVDFQGRNDFVGVDHVHGVRVEYRRVPEHTEP
ncbi:MAG TPA: hypothetical protein VFM98_26040 [Ramlibacter sp.]|uniref:hypothetical protein n=1 Tax=Ramlibacter sp. TaxID=1917967 RepID=UPI002D7E9E5C|nr:hypothetical protein [Ramlibacter sp.]HET8749081.1 hypothetical protein [Ramlibacter sp.]